MSSVVSAVLELDSNDVSSQQDTWAATTPLTAEVPPDLSTGTVIRPQFALDNQFAS